MMPSISRNLVKFYVGADFGLERGRSVGCRSFIGSTTDGSRYLHSPPSQYNAGLFQAHRPGGGFAIGQVANLSLQEPQGYSRGGSVF